MQAQKVGSSGAAIAAPESLTSQAPPSSRRDLEAATRTPASTVAPEGGDERAVMGTKAPPSHDDTQHPQGTKPLGSCSKCGNAQTSPEDLFCAKDGNRY